MCPLYTELRRKYFKPYFCHRENLYKFEQKLLLPAVQRLLLLLPALHKWLLPAVQKCVLLLLRAVQKWQLLLPCVQMATAMAGSISMAIATVGTTSVATAIST